MEQIAKDREEKLFKKDGETTEKVMFRGRARFQVLKERQKRVTSSQRHRPEDRQRRKAVGISLR